MSSLLDILISAFSWVKSLVFGLIPRKVSSDNFSSNLCFLFKECPGCPLLKQSLLCFTMYISQGLFMFMFTVIFFFLPGYVTTESAISCNISLKTKMKKLIQFFMYQRYTIALFCLFLRSLNVIYLGGMRGKNWAVLYLSSQQVQQREAQRQHLLIAVLPSTSTL